MIENAAGLSAAPDCYAGKSPTNVKAKVVVLNGLLDPNTPISGNEEVYNNLIMATGYTKVSFTHLNGGH